MSRKLLIVAYDFPPIASAGMVRVVSMSKYLSLRGWNVTVLTVRDSFIQQSPSTLDLISDRVTVVRTRTFEFAKLLKKLRPQGRGTVSRIVRSLLGALDSLDRLLGFPDRKNGWFFPLLFNSWKMIRRHRYDAVLSSSPPHSTHLALLVLRRFVKFRWVVDFRDPWTAPARSFSRTSRLRSNRWVERKTLDAADAVIVNTEGNEKALLETFPHLREEKISVVTNGFDTDWLNDFDSPTGQELSADLVYIGHIYPHMLDSYLAALEQMQHSGERIPSLKIIGRRPSYLSIPEDLERYVVFGDRVPFRESLSIMRHANALLYLVPHGLGFETWVPSKLYPYMFSTTPVLALVPDGDVVRILEQTGVGVVVRSQDPGDIARQLSEFLKNTNGRQPSRIHDESGLSRYTWDTLSSRIDAVLGSVLEI
jgi:glycosyltransferase involved in cell wall biosynthesis